MKKRILFSDNGSLTDLSAKLNDYFSGSLEFSLVAAQDALYIGSMLPFNHIFFKLGTTVNANASTMSIAYWDSDSWTGVVDIIDETDIGGVSLAQSGMVSFVPSKSKNWVRYNTNYGSQTITELSSVEIYDLYWLKITFNNNLTDDVDISWVGNIFSQDNDLGTEFPDLNRLSLKTAYQSGKITWEEQSIRAAEIIEKDLISKKEIISIEQVLDKDDIKLMSISKVAEIIYIALGDDYNDQANAAQKEYRRRLDNYLLKIDQNSNAILDTSERVYHTGRLYR